MQRQNSASSVNGDGGGGDDGAEEKKDGELKDNSGAGGLTKALFGALYTLAKEKFSDSAQVALINVAVDFLLILVIFLHLEYPWAVNPDSGVYQFFFWLEIQRPLAAKGLSFYVGIFYLVNALLYLCIGTCIWVAWCFKNDNFPFLWPIKFVRIVASIFFGTFYIASINIFLTAAECVPHDGHWVHHIWDDDCMSMPMMIHVAMALISSVLFASVNLLLVMADHELKPLSPSLLAAPHSMTELKSVILKTIITAVDILATPWLKVQAVIFFMCTALNLYWHVAQLPYYTAWMNCLRSALYAIHAWVSLCLVVLMFKVDAVREGENKEPTTTGAVYWTYEGDSYADALSITNAMWYGILPAFILGGTAAFVRLAYFFRVGLRFRFLTPDKKSRLLYKFSSDTDVEVISRVLRVWDEDHVPDPIALELGETILKSGLQQFPQAPFVRIAYANFLIECKQQMQSGWSQLEMARKMHPNMSYRFSIFTWEQEHKQKAATSSSGNNTATDLVSYVEFQKNYKNLLLYHRAALMATRNFWGVLMHDKVSIVTLGNAFRKINLMEGMADKTYKLVLERYPNSVKLLRAYADFLETVKNDPWAAAQYYAKADKQEEEQDAAQEEGNTNNDGKQGGLFDARGNAVITISSMGVIQTANKAACTMFGYAKSDLEKKNVKVLMPQPFAGRHDQFLRNYMTSGKAKILDSVREVLGQHAQKYVFPIRIMVSRASGTGADSVFMGVLKTVEADKSIIRAWLLPSGIILCVDQNFIDYAGWASKDLLGKPFSSLVPDQGLITGMLARAAEMTEEQLLAGAVCADTKIHHKHADDVPVNMRFEMGGTQDQRLLVVTMKRMGPTEPMVVFDHHGVLMYSNTVFANLMGYDAAKMAGMKIAQLMAEPFGYLHQRWLREQDDHVTKPTPGSCRGSQAFDLLSANGTYLTARLTVAMREAGDHHQFVVKATKIAASERDDGRRLLLHLDSRGVVVYVAPSPLALFAFPPAALLGKTLADVVDVFGKWREAGNDVDEALEAMLQYSSNNVGASWRVGVIPSYTDAALSKAPLSRRASSGLGAEAGAAGTGAGAAGGPPTVAAMLKVLSSVARGKPAVMQVRALKPASGDPSRSSTPGGAAAVAGAGAPVVAVTLWRPELLTGILELDRNLKILKADNQAAMALGHTTPALYNKPLTRFMHCAPTLSFDELMGVKAKNIQRGGLKGRKAHPLHAAGPKRQFEGRHSDGYPLGLTLQAALKHGNDTSRMVLMLKSSSAVKGDMDVLTKLLFDPDALRGADDGASANDQGSVQAAEQPNAKVPALALGKLRSIPELPEASGKGTVAAGMVPLTDRSANGDQGGDDALVTARDVDLRGLASARDGEGLTARGVELQEGDSGKPGSASKLNGRGASPSGSPRASPGLPPTSRLSSPSPLQEARRRSIAELTVQDASAASRGMSDDSAKIPTPPSGAGGKGALLKPSPSLVRAQDSFKRNAAQPWHHVDHQDPDEVPIPEDAEFEIDHHQVVREDMDISDHEDSDGEDEDAEMLRQQAMEGLDPGEQTEMKKSIRIVKGWLHSSYNHRHHEGGHHPPSRGWVVPDEPEGGAEAGGRAGGTPPMKHHGGGGEGEDGEAGEKAGEGSGEEEEDVAAGDGGRGGSGERQEHAPEVTESDFKRGKRLKRLMKLLSGKKATRALSRLKLHIWVVIGSLLLLHVAFFLVVLMYVWKQQAYVQYISAAGEAIHRTHVVATYSTAIDAALRGYGFDVPTNMAFLYAQLTSTLDRLTYLHNGLYLGFGKDAAPSDSQLDSLWNSQAQPVYQYQDTSPPEQVLTLMSLWDLGGSYLAAGRQVGYVAQMAASNATSALPITVTTLATNRFWLFVRDNGAGSLQAGYLHVLDKILLQAQSLSATMNVLLIALMVVEATLVVVGGLGYMVVLLRSAALSRAALFTVFLFIPSGLLKSLANKSVALSDPDDDEKKAGGAKGGGAAAKQKPLGSGAVGALSAKALQSAGGSTEDLVVPFDGPSNHGGGGGGGGGGMGGGGKRVSMEMDLLAPVGHANSTAFSAMGGVKRHVSIVPLPDSPMAGRTASAAVAKKKVSMDLGTRGGGDSDDDGKAGPPPAAAKRGSLDGPAPGGAFSKRRSLDGPAPSGGHRGSLDGVGAGARSTGRMSMDPWRREMDDPRSRISMDPRVMPSVEPGDSASQQGEEDDGEEGGGGAMEGGRGSGRAQSFSGTYKRQISGEIDIEHNIFNSKQLTETHRDLYKLCWPFLLWGVLVIVAYAVSITSFASLPSELINIKLLERSLGQASRVTFYASQLALGVPGNVTAQAALQATLATEASWLYTVYHTSLYGGPTLSDSVSDDSQDDGSGSLFVNTAHAYMLFLASGCLRTTDDAGGTSFGPPCSNTSSYYYQVSTHAIDPMMRRLITEAGLMAQDLPPALVPNSTRWQYIWTVARVDLSDALTTLAADFTSDTNKTFSNIQLLHIVVLVLVLASVAIYMFFVFRPFLAASFEESKRVAELLAMLPSDMEVEAMVEATYTLVIKHRLDKNALHVSGSSPSMAGLRAMSRFFGSMMSLTALRSGTLGTGAGSKAALLGASSKGGNGNKHAEGAGTMAAAAAPPGGSAPAPKRFSLGQSWIERNGARDSNGNLIRASTTSLFASMGKDNRVHAAPAPAMDERIPSVTSSQAEMFSYNRVMDIDTPGLPPPRPLASMPLPAMPGASAAPASPRASYEATLKAINTRPNPFAPGAANGAAAGQQSPLSGSPRTSNPQRTTPVGQKPPPIPSPESSSDFTRFNRVLSGLPEPERASPTTPVPAAGAGSGPEGWQVTLNRSASHGSRQGSRAGSPSTWGRAAAAAAAAASPRPPSGGAAGDLDRAVAPVASEAFAPKLALLGVGGAPGAAPSPLGSRNRRTSAPSPDADPAFKVFGNNAYDDQVPTTALESSPDGAHDRVSPAHLSRSSDEQLSSSLEQQQLDAIAALPELPSSPAGRPGSANKAPMLGSMARRQGTGGRQGSPAGQAAQAGGEQEVQKLLQRLMAEEQQLPRNNNGGGGDNTDEVTAFELRQSDAGAAAPAANGNEDPSLPRGLDVEEAEEPGDADVQEVAPSPRVMRASLLANGSANGSGKGSGSGSGRLGVSGLRKASSPEEAAVQSLLGQMMAAGEPGGKDEGQAQ